MCGEQAHPRAGPRDMLLVASIVKFSVERHEVAQLDAALRLLPPVTLAGFDLIPDPRLSSWAEMCSIGRSFVSALSPLARVPADEARVP